MPYTAQVFLRPGNLQRAGDGQRSANANWTDTATNLTGGVPGVSGFLGDTAALGKTAGPVTLTLDSASPAITGLTFNSSGDTPSPRVTPAMV